MDLLPLIDFEEAFSVYCRAQARLPPIPPPVDQVLVPGLLHVAEAFDVILLDAYGVLNAGDQALPGAVEAVAGLRKLRKPCYVLSNDASSEKRDMVAAHNRRGFPFVDADIIAPQELLPRALAEFPHVRRWGVIASPDWPVGCLGKSFEILGDDFDRYDGILFLASRTWNEAAQLCLETALEARPRPLVIANPDVAAPDEDGRLSAPPGYFGHRIAEATGVSPRFIGKPFPEIFEVAMARHPDVPPKRFLMVGDSLHTDILGARHVGMRAMLVTQSGILKGRDWCAHCLRCGIWPQFVAAAIAGAG